MVAEVSLVRPRAEEYSVGPCYSHGGQNVEQVHYQILQGCGPNTNSTDC